MSRSVSAAANSAPEQFRALTLPFLPELVEILFADARDRECVGHRTAVNALLDGLKITRSEDRLVALLLDRANARDESHLLSLVERARFADGISLDQAKRQALEVLKLAMADDPACESEIRIALFGRRVDASSAVVMDA